MDKEIAKIDLVSNNACDTIIYYKVAYKRTQFLGDSIVAIRKLTLMGRPHQNLH